MAATLFLASFTDAVNGFYIKKRETRTFDFAIFKSQVPWVQGHRKESTQPRTYGLDSSDTLQVSFTRSLRINCLLENRQRQLLMLTEKNVRSIAFLVWSPVVRTGFQLSSFLILDSDNLWLSPVDKKMHKPELYLRVVEPYKS
jgi:hypothetical protein